jgi:hypothetical protein
MDLIGSEVVDDLLLHAPPVHEARVDQKGMFARTITFTDREVDYWTRKEALYRVHPGYRRVRNLQFMGR